jgi:hypothetical protein
MTVEGDVIPLDGFEVVAVRGEGVYVVDGDSNCWHVGGPHKDTSNDNKLAAAYRDAIDN